MYGIKEVREVFEDPSYQKLFYTPWLGQAWKGDKPQISELKLRKKLRTESTEKHSNDNKNTRVLMYAQGKTTVCQRITKRYLARRQLEWTMDHVTSKVEAGDSVA